LQIRKILIYYISVRVKAHNFSVKKQQEVKNEG